MIAKLKHYFYRIKSGALKEMVEQIKWIYSYARKHIFSIIVYTGLGLSGALVGLFSSLVSRDLVDIITGRNTGKLLMSFCLIILTQLVSVLIGQASTYINRNISMKVENNIKSEVYGQIMVTDWESLSRYHSGDLLSRWSGDVSMISTGILTLIPNFIISIFRFFSSFLMVVYYDSDFK